MALALRVSGNRGRAGQRRAGERRELSFQYWPRRPKVKNDREGRLVRDSPHPSRCACLVRDYRPEPHSDRLGRTPMEAGVSGPLFALGALSLCRREEKEGDRGRNRVRVACTLTLIFSTHFSHASWTSLSPQSLPLDSSSISWAKSSRRATTSCSSGDRGRSREREREREGERQPTRQEGRWEDWGREPTDCAVRSFSEVSSDAICCGSTCIGLPFIVCAYVCVEVGGAKLYLLK